MGMTVDARAYNIEEMKSTFEKVYDENAEALEGKMRPSEFLDIIMPKLGTVFHDKLIVVWNDYAEDYNGALNLIVALDEYYGEDLMDTYRLKRTVDINSYGDRVTSYEAEKWGIPNWPENEEEDWDY